MKVCLYTLAKDNNVIVSIEFLLKYMETEHVCCVFSQINVVYLIFTQTVTFTMKFVYGKSSI